MILDDTRRDTGTDYVQTELRSYRGKLEQERSRMALPDNVADALSYIHCNLFDESLSVAAVCHHLGLRNHNISCRFKQAVGQGMRDYIESRRLGAARRLLQFSALTILDIAWSVGYAYPETFARAFRRRAGCSASAFRERFDSGDGALVGQPEWSPTFTMKGAPK